MVARSILFSFVVSIASLVIVAYAPITTTDSSEGKAYSPYREELDALREKTAKGLHPSAPEWDELEKLTEKNNEWFESRRVAQIAESKSTSGILRSWKRRSSLLSPVVMLLWGVLFYFFMRNRPPKKQALLALTFPVVLVFAQLMSLLEVALIVLVVLAIWMWLRRNPPGPESA